MVEKTSPETVTAQAERSARRELVRRFRLLVSAGPDQGLKRLSEGKPLTVGTHETSDLVLTDRTVSRFHCEISLADGQPILRDLGSRNGTMVDGVPVLQAPLRSGAKLMLGHSEIQFEIGNETVEIATSDRERFGTLIGKSTAMRAVFAHLEKVAASDATLLLEGETGTGKEMAAESVHRESARREGPFIVVDCGAIPPNLLDSELFGHEKGAFTGAIEARPGAFEEAHGGTIFLDEVGELDSELQPKLLRALEQRKIRRVGANRTTSIDVRVIAATHRNLRTEVNEGRFRPDLYYRLAVIPVRLPPLRDRREDLPLLVAQLLEEMGVRGKHEAARLETGAFLAQLGRHSWPGNVRELRNYLEQCLLLHKDASLATPPATVDPEIDTKRTLKAARELWVQSFERRYLEAMLRANDGNVRAAARAAGVDRIYFYRLLWRHGLR